MKKTRFRNIWLTVIAVSLLGWLTACAESTGMMDKPMDTDMHGDMTSSMQNMLMGSDGHHATGKVSIDMGMNNTHVLTLSDIELDKVPDGFVYLANNGDCMHGVELGMLNHFTGRVSFDIPSDVNPNDYDTVIIWCKQFHVEIGRAYLPKKMI